MGEIRCFHCGGEVIWQSDFTFDDFGLEGDGIVHVCKCSECNADVEYYVPFHDDDELVVIEPEREEPLTKFEWQFLRMMP